VHGGLVAIGGPEIIATRLAADRPTLAICVGHQVLFEAGIEHGLRAEGCSVWPGLVERLHAERLPHMGWNTIQAPSGSRLFAANRIGTVLFRAQLRRTGAAGSSDRRITWAEHGGDRFVAAVEEGALWSTQFHPKSQVMRVLG
jgi:glutamine amidotransferase